MRIVKIFNAPGHDGAEIIALDVKRLRLVTIVAPIAFLIAVEILSVVVLVPLLGGSAIVRLALIFTVLIVAAVPFSFWVFATMDRQQRSVAWSAGRRSPAADRLRAGAEAGPADVG